jgi:hypothetical protein
MIITEKHLGSDYAERDLHSRVRRKLNERLETPAAWQQQIIELPKELAGQIRARLPNDHWNP